MLSRMISASAALATLGALAVAQDSPQVKNIILFVGDGMGVSTVTATRIYSVGIEGSLMMDQMPYVALNRTYSSDAITTDSAPSASAMCSGVRTNNGVLGFGPTCEYQDFNGDGDGPATTTIAERYKQAGRKVGLVSTARITHATPASAYVHINDRDQENTIALQALPGDAQYNPALGTGLDFLAGGGRRHFVPNTVNDEEGSKGSRTDGRDLRAEFQNAGYTYVWETGGFNALTQADLPVLALLESSHMEYEHDRPGDAGGEPDLVTMTSKAIETLSNPNGFFLMVEAGRIDHAHHAGNAFRALKDTEIFDKALAQAISMVDLSETLIVVTADHSHVFNIAGYPLRPASELQYSIANPDAGWLSMTNGGIFDVVYDVNPGTNSVAPATDANGVPYTTLVYGNGPGYRVGPRVDPRLDTTPGLNGVIPAGPADPAYLQEAAVPLSSETHSAEEVAVYAIGKGSGRVRGTISHTRVGQLLRWASGL
ncbi:MAG: alkaline phosphatase [Planctomycetes bacterium]|nr:alkaline phosphatase [Planctomycetota bacterium]